MNGYREKSKFKRRGRCGALALSPIYSLTSPQFAAAAQGKKMVDRVSSKERSAMMGRVRRQNTKPEMQIRKAMHHRGYRYRLHRTDLPGTPDFVLPKYRVAVLVHGCFWHAHIGCRYNTYPKTRADFWRQKKDANALRDQKNVAALERLGWRTVIVWECALKHVGVSESAATIEKFLKNSDEYHIEISGI